jgi:hypothetical protein
MVAERTFREVSALPIVVTLRCYEIKGDKRHRNMTRLRHAFVRHRASKAPPESSVLTGQPVTRNSISFQGGCEDAQRVAPDHIRQVLARKPAGTQRGCDLCSTCCIQAWRHGRAAVPVTA